MLELQNNLLVFSFPEVHADARLAITLHRTFRIPDDGKNYPLPPSCGVFPVRHVDDFADKVPQKWTNRGGVMVPLYQSEAMWLAFSPQYSNLHSHHYPFAIKIATGKVSALTGKKWSKKLKDGEYMVSPTQKWLDGYAVEDGIIRQFVAAPLGLGITAEEQITGKAEFGGIQIEVVPMDPEKFAKRFPKRPPPPPQSFGDRRTGGGGLLRSAGVRKKSIVPTSEGYDGPKGVPCAAGPAAAAEGSAGGFPFGYSVPGVYTSTLVSADATTYSCNNINVLSEAEARAKRPEMYARGEEKTLGGINLDLCREISDSDDSVELSAVNLDMGLAAGGKMVQQVFKDPFGLGEWSKTAKTRCYVHMCNSMGWQHLTGQLPPHVPMTAAHYTRGGFPWFHHYAEGAASQSGTELTNGLKSVAQITAEKKIPILPENQSVSPVNIVIIPASKSAVRDGVWK